MFDNNVIDEMKFAEFLLKKNSVGNMRSIHLNAIPSKRGYTKLPLDKFDLVGENKSEEFLNKLFRNKNFTFKISLKDQTKLADRVKELQTQLEDTRDDDLLRQLKSEIKILEKKLHEGLFIFKSLSSICSKTKEEEQETGIKTFAFGYPLIVKRSMSDSNKIVKAPLILFYLNIEQSTKEARTWTIKRNEDYPVIINNLLISYIENDLAISLSKLREILPEEESVDEKKVIEVLNEFVKTIKPNSSSSFREVLSISKLDKIEDKLIIEKNCRQNNGLLLINNGVFGNYRISKESILADLKKIIDGEIKGNDREDNTRLSLLSPIETDPSQQRIINSLQEENKILIQGPPGTGKSQSLSAIITNALSNRKRCLIVCEKKTALDVIAENLRKEGLGELVTTITHPITDRTKVVKEIRELFNIEHSFSRLPEDNFIDSEDKILRLIKKINTRHKSLLNIDFGNKIWTSLVGDFLKAKKSIKENPLNKVLNQDNYNFDVEEFKELIQQIRDAYKYYYPIRDIESLCKINRSEYIDLTILESQRDIKEKVTQHLKEAKELMALISSFEEKYYRRNLKYFNGSYKKVLEQLESALTMLKSMRKDYLTRLNAYYSKIDQQIESQILELEKVMLESEAKYDQEFLQNSLLNNTRIALGSIVSKKYKDLKMSRDKVILLLENLKNYIEENDLGFSLFEQCDLSSGDDLSEVYLLIDNLKEYMKAYKRRSLIDIKKYVESMTLEKPQKHHRVDLPGEINSFKKEYKGIIEFVKENSLLNLNLKNNQPTSKLIKEFKNKISKTETLLEDSAERSQEIVREANLKDSSINAKIEIPKEYKTIVVKEAILREGLDSLWLEHKLGKELSIKEVYQQLEELEKLFENGIREIDYEWDKFYNFVKHIETLDYKVKSIVDTLYQSGVKENWDKYFSHWYFSILLERLYEEKTFPDSTTENFLEDLRYAISENQRRQKEQILAIWAKEKSLRKQQYEAGEGMRRSIVSLYNLRGSYGNRRNSLKKVINKSFNLFTSVKPVVLTNPITCSTIFPLQKNLFDIVIFDEASQLRIEDTYPSLLRGKIKVISGDKYQMPPSYYFKGRMDFVEFEDEEIGISEELERIQEDYRDLFANLVESESLLEFAEMLDFKKTHLDTHYRSRHPDLVAFSNAAFYGENLIPLPKKFDEAPIIFHRVDGLYKENENLDEIQYIFALLKDIHKNPDGTYPSIGIATLNQKQQNRFYEEIALSEDEEFRSMIENMQQSGLFIKNLENIQGEERDIIILSTTFGRDDKNKFIQNFGPINRKKGHRLLNVLITRAKSKIHVCTSIPQEYISNYREEINMKGNTGKGVFYAYLAYARAVSEGNEENKEQILEILRNNCPERNHDDSLGLFQDVESIFEEEVIDRLERYIDSERIIPQYKAGGFRIDFVVKDLAGKPRLAIECDGAKYHSSEEAYCWDICRQKQLEEHGFIFHRIWSTEWFTNEERELEKLIDFVRENENPNN